jgi:beta-phosphoglucomutase-like phosphatase (HAD superfamily)
MLASLSVTDCIVISDISGGVRSGIAAVVKVIFGLDVGPLSDMSVDEARK